MKRYCISAALLALGVASSSVAAEAYKIDKTHADLLFAIQHAGFTHKYGWFREFDGVLQYDAAKPENSKVEVTVKTASVDTSLAARDEDLRSAQFLDTVNYPEMRFESTRVVPGKDRELRVEGNLTLHGVTRPFTLNATLNKAAPNPFDKTPTLGFSATGTLKRSDFGVSNLVPVLADVVQVTLEIEFKRAP